MVFPYLKACHFSLFGLFSLVSPGLTWNPAVNNDLRPHLQDPWPWRRLGFARVSRERRAGSLGNHRVRWEETMVRESKVSPASHPRHHQPSVRLPSHLPASTPDLSQSGGGVGGKRRLSHPDAPFPLPPTEDRGGGSGVRSVGPAARAAARRLRDSGGGRWPAALGPAPTLATFASVISSPASCPAKPCGRAAPDPGGLPGRN